ncbi:hypothetical protein AQUCO_02500197v1 [Aquilegia coerulea]|uniref:Uncharacterized protein n=1 Tax=Aquilegia coerulea TaxID=218851 RepID=A0A2G5DA18_AQUCA|nr:hypothetical protein AQUCO_02500197v1 [Aquilegia coerulea]
MESLVKYCCLKLVPLSHCTYIFTSNLYMHKFIEPSREFGTKKEMHYVPIEQEYHYSKVGRLWKSCLTKKRETL